MSQTRDYQKKQYQIINNVHYKKDCSFLLIILFEKLRRKKTKIVIKYGNIITKEEFPEKEQKGILEISSLAVNGAYNYLVIKDAKKKEQKVYELSILEIRDFITKEILYQI